MSSRMTTAQHLRQGERVHRAMRWWEVLSLGEHTDDGRIRLNLQDVRDGEPRSILIRTDAAMRAYAPKESV